MYKDEDGEELSEMLQGLGPSLSSPGPKGKVSQWNSILAQIFHLGSKFVSTRPTLTKKCK